MPRGEAVNLTGQTRGRWTVLERVGTTPRGVVLWKCRCACGAEDVVQGNNLLSGASEQCRWCGWEQAVRTRREKRKGT